MQGGPSGTKANRLQSGTPCKWTTLACTAANACTRPCFLIPGTMLISMLESRYEKIVSVHELSCLLSNSVQFLVSTRLLPHLLHGLLRGLCFNGRVLRQAHLFEEGQGEGFCGDVVGVVFEQGACHEPHSIQLLIFALNALQRNNFLTTIFGRHT